MDNIEIERKNDVRLPWIHNKDVVDLDFHSLDTLPSKNHIAVFSCCTLDAKL